MTMIQKISIAEEANPSRPFTAAVGTTVDLASMACFVLGGGKGVHVCGQTMERGAGARWTQEPFKGKSNAARPKAETRRGAQVG